MSFFKNTRLIAGLAIAGILCAAGLVYAQVNPPPVVATVHNTTDLIPISPNGAPSAQGWQVAPAQISNAPQYVKVTPTSANASLAAAPGYTNYFAQAQTYFIIVLTNTMPYSYAYAATAPSDGARECVVGSGGAITQLTFVAASGQTVTGGANISVTSGSGVCFTYSLANLTWDRS
jgi:hypothetical protein